MLGALERAPQAFWVYSLKVLARPGPNGGLTPVELLGVWKQACVGLEKAAKAAPEDEALRQMLEEARQSFGAACVEAGRNLDEAEAITRQMLASTPTTNWNYGNVVYDAHSVLGRIALRHGDRETARKELRAAGRTPGSPQLNSFGPQFTLARELLQHGEQADREERRRVSRRCRQVLGQPRHGARLCRRRTHSSSSSRSRRGKARSGPAKFRSTNRTGLDSAPPRLRVSAVNSCSFVFHSAS